jgi:hypothetical protein
MGLLGASSSECGPGIAGWEGLHGCICRGGVVMRYGQLIGFFLFTLMITGIGRGLGHDFRVFHAGFS